MATISFAVGRNITPTSTNLGSNIYTCYIRSDGGTMKSFFEGIALVTPSEEETITKAKASSVNTTNSVNSDFNSKIKTYSIPGYCVNYSSKNKEIKGWGWWGGARATDNNFFKHNTLISPWSSTSTRQWNFLKKPVLVYDNLHGSDTSMPTLSVSGNKLHVYIGGSEKGSCKYDPNTDKIVLYWGNPSASVSLESGGTSTMKFTDKGAGMFPSIPYVGAILHFQNGDATGPMLEMAGWGGTIWWRCSQFSWSWHPKIKYTISYSISCGEISSSWSGTKPSASSDEVYKSIINGGTSNLGNSDNTSSSKSIGSHSSGHDDNGLYAYYPHLGISPGFATYTTVYGTITAQAGVSLSASYDYLINKPSFTRSMGSIGWGNTRGTTFNSSWWGGNYVIDISSAATIGVPKSWNVTLSSTKTATQTKVYKGDSEWGTVGGTGSIPSWWNAGELTADWTLSSDIKFTVTGSTGISPVSNFYPCAIVVWTDKGE